jgi:hypothetical protein
MKSTTRTSRLAAQSDSVAQWQQALRGDAQARSNLLGRIMPVRSYRAAK